MSYLPRCLPAPQSLLFVLACTTQAWSHSPSTCGIAQPAFCDTFDAPAGTGNRSGDHDGTVWGVSRLLGPINFGQSQYDAVASTMMDRCGTQVQVLAPHDVAICNGMLVDAQYDQHGVTSLAMYPTNE